LAIQKPTFGLLTPPSTYSIVSVNFSAAEEISTMKGGDNMKRMLLVLGGITVLAFVATQAWAGMTLVADSDLSGISGKADNSFTMSGGIVQTLTTDNSANVEVGVEQWNDTHATDASDHKGANDQSGANTQVQANDVADTIVINWGAAATLNWVTDTESSGDVIAQMPYAVFANGGF
jgi:hypothetical protein